MTPLYLVFYFRVSHLSKPLKIWVRLSQGALARVSDVPAVSEVECLEIRTSSCYFQQTGVSDVEAAPEVE